MKIATRTAIIAAVLASSLPGLSMAGSPAKSAPPNKPVYPYKDLPGVLAPQPLKTADDKFKCRTTTIHPYAWRGIYYRGLPRLGYVCDQDGVVSWSTRPPNWSYWQYNDPNR
jgi:hypothetical protein